MQCVITYWTITTPFIYSSNALRLIRRWYGPRSWNYLLKREGKLNENKENPGQQENQCPKEPKSKDPHTVSIISLQFLSRILLFIKPVQWIVNGILGLAVSVTISFDVRVLITVWWVDGFVIEAKKSTSNGRFLNKQKNTDKPWVEITEQFTQ